MKRLRIFIILLNYNGYNDTVECIQSLKNLNNNENYDINTLIVDNFSSKIECKKLKLLSKKFKNLILIFNESNNGYAAGNNIGIDAALKNKADYIWILNNDVVVDENSLNELIIASKGKQGFFSTKIYNYYDKQELMYFGGKIIPTKYAVEFNKEEGVNDICSDFICGVCIFAHKNLWEKYKLPEEYFLYEEDTDFSLNLKHDNIPIYVVAKAKIYHKESASTYRLSYIKHYYFERNKMLLRNKYSKKYSKYCFVIKMLLYPFRTLRRFIKGLVYKMSICIMQNMNF